MIARSVIYASDDWGIHDQRWVAALESCGFVVTVVTGSGAAANIASADLPGAPVLAGPLTTVTRHLVDLPRPIVGLSWGFDLQQDHGRASNADELDWISALDRLIVDSPSSAAIARSLGLPADRIHLLPWGVDLDQFAPTGSATRFGFPGDSRIIASLRRHDDLHRTADVIEAFAIAAARDANLRLVMAGSGPLTASHQSRVAELDLVERAIFPGQVDESTVAELLRGADAYVTATETDGTSVTLLQAMACRVPVLASAIPGNDWWIQDGDTGRTFPVGDVDLLAELMTTDRPSDARLDRARAAVIERADWLRNRQALREIMAFPESGESPKRRTDGT